MPGNCAPHSEGKSACFHPGGGQNKVDYIELCILHLKRFLRLPPRDLHSHSAQHAAHQYWRPLTVKGGS